MEAKKALTPLWAIVEDKRFDFVDLARVCFHAKVDLLEEDRDLGVRELLRRAAHGASDAA